MWTTAATFYGLTFVDFPSLQQLGRLIGHSMVLCGVFTLVIVPALAARAAVGAAPAPRSRCRASRRGWPGAGRRSGSGAVVITIVLGVAATRLRINPTLDRLRSVTPGAALLDRVGASSGCRKRFTRFCRRARTWTRSSSPTSESPLRFGGRCRRSGCRRPRPCCRPSRRSACGRSRFEALASSPHASPPPSHRRRSRKASSRIPSRRSSNGCRDSRARPAAHVRGLRESRARRSHRALRGPSGHWMGGGDLRVSRDRG